MTPPRLRRATTLVFAALAGCAGETSGDPASSAAAAARVSDEARDLGMPARFENALGMRFVLLPRGDFVLGAAGGADDAAHEARMFRGFYLQDAEVTNAQFRRFRPAHDSGPGRDGDAQPAVRVSHDDAVAFAAWVAAQDPRWAYRLPWETEWEYGARAGGACEGHGRANPWGVGKASGALREWCGDWHAEYPSWVVTDPTGPNEGTERVVRGGAARARGRAPPAARFDDVGFRLATPSGYGGDDRGSCPVTFRTFDPDVAGDGRARSGYVVRVIQVEDRLQSRQRGVRPLPWVPLPGRTSPGLAVRLAPGRYYAQAERADGAEGAAPDGPLRGLEMKFWVRPDHPLVVDLPVPKPGADLPEPE